MKEKTDIIYCPFIEVRIKELNSDLIDSFGSFPMQVILSVNEGKSVREIAKGVIVSESVVENTIQELIDKQMIEKKLFNYKLTYLGKKYVDNHSFIKKFRQNTQNRMAVNCFTGQLEKIWDEKYFSYTRQNITSGAFVLANKLKGSEYLLHSPDYENTKKYLKSFMNLKSVSLTEDDYEEYIHFKLEPVDPGKVFYVPYIIPVNSYINSDTDNDTASDYAVRVKIPVQKAKRIFYSPVDKMPDLKTLTAALSYLMEYHKDLLSEKAFTIFKDLELTDKFNKKSKTIFMDCYSGKEFDEHLRQGSVRKREDICLPIRNQFKKGMIPLKKDGMEGFFYEYHDEGIEYFTLSLDFSKLRQASGGDLT